MEYKKLMLFKNNNIHSPKQKQNIIFSKFSKYFISKYPLKHQYLPETSYIKMIPTVSFIHQYKNSSLKTIIKGTQCRYEILPIPSSSYENEQKSMLKISLLFKKFTNLSGKNTHGGILSLSTLSGLLESFPKSCLKQKFLLLLY